MREEINAEVVEECTVLLDSIIDTLTPTGGKYLYPSFDFIQSEIVIIDESDEGRRPAIQALGAVLFLLAQYPEFEVVIGCTVPMSFRICVMPGLYAKPDGTGYGRFSWEDVLGILKLIKKKLTI